MADEYDLSDHHSLEGTISNAESAQISKGNGYDYDSEEDYSIESSSRSVEDYSNCTGSESKDKSEDIESEEGDSHKESDQYFDSD